MRATALYVLALGVRGFRVIALRLELLTIPEGRPEHRTRQREMLCWKGIPLVGGDAVPLAKHFCFCFSMFSFILKQAKYKSGQQTTNDKDAQQGGLKKRHSETTKEKQLLIARTPV